MAVGYINGGGPLYPGVSFIDETGFCQLIRDLLVGLGWTVVSGSPSNLPMVVRSAIAVDGVYVYLHFTYALDNNSHTIRVTGTTDGISANPSPVPTESVFTNASSATTHVPIRFTQGGDNRLWAVADEDTLVIYVRAAQTLWRTCSYYGRLDISVANPNDGWAWGIFDMAVYRSGVIPGQFPGYFARRFNTPVYWATIAGNEITQIEWTGYNVIQTLNRSYQTQTASHNVGMALFDAVQNYKIPIVPFWRAEQGNHFRGIFKFVVRGLYGAAIDSIHTCYIPEANKIAYYISFTTGSNGSGSGGLPWTAGIGGMLIAES